MANYSEPFADDAANAEEASALELSVVDLPQDDMIVQDAFDGRHDGTLPHKVCARIISILRGSFLFAEPAQKKKFHFFPRHDIALLRQAVADRPFLAPHGRANEAWATMAQKLRNVGLLAETRSVRERFTFLVGKYKKDELMSLRKSGTDEGYGEREMLLGEVGELLNEADEKRKDAQQKKVVNTVLVNQFRDEAMQTLKNKRNKATIEHDASRDDESVSSDASSRIGTRKRTLRSILDEREDRFRRSEELERLRLANEEKKLKIDEERLRLEEKKLDAAIEAQKQQTQLLNALVMRLTSNNRWVGNAVYFMTTKMRHVLIQ
jgi:hypothetical protein